MDKEYAQNYSYGNFMHQDTYKHRMIILQRNALQKCMSAETDKYQKPRPFVI